MAEGVDPDRGREERLDDRIVRRMQEQPGHVSFNGLRRSLGAHPESLSRALRRLERFGVVLHDAAGYALAEGPGTEFDGGVRPPFHRVGEVGLPPGVDPTWLLGEFAGRWFKDLRWVGLIEGRDDPWLIWTVPGEGGHVFLTWDGDRLQVGADQPPHRSERVDAAARALLARCLERLARRPALAGADRRYFGRRDLGSLPN